jgi:hypothetical protein
MSCMAHRELANYRRLDHGQGKQLAEERQEEPEAEAGQDEARCQEIATSPWAARPCRAVWAAVPQVMRPGPARPAIGGRRWLYSGLRTRFSLRHHRPKLETVGAAVGPARKACVWRVSEWLAATLEMSCRVTGCGFESHALRSGWFRGFWPSFRLGRPLGAHSP